ncbi:MAG: CsgG/HfaB family protein [Synechococcus sp.]
MRMKLALSCLAALSASFALNSALVPTLPGTSSNGRYGGIAYAQSTTTERLRVAVLDFDFSPTNSSSLWAGGARGVNELLVNKLVQDGTYSVIERSRINAILAEQDLGASGRVDASTAAEIGRILGVEAVIFGTVTEFAVDRQSSSGSVGFFGVTAGTDSEKANVRLNARMVSTNTAEILAVAEGTGAADQSDTSVFILGTGGGSSTDNTERLLSAASEQAIDQVVVELVGASDSLAALPAALPDVEAIVADVFGSEVVFNKGASDGLQEGMVLTVETVVREVTDPQTGDVIRRVTQPSGRVELTDVDAGSSLGRIMSGSMEVGDVATVSDEEAPPNLLDLQ